MLDGNLTKLCIVSTKRQVRMKVANKERTGYNKIKINTKREYHRMSGFSLSMWFVSLLGFTCSFVVTKRSYVKLLSTAYGLVVKIQVEPFAQTHMTWFITNSSYRYVNNEYTPWIVRALFFYALDLPFSRLGARSFLLHNNFVYIWLCHIQCESMFQPGFEH